MFVAKLPLHLIATAYVDDHALCFDDAELLVRFQDIPGYPVEPPKFVASCANVLGPWKIVDVTPEGVLPGSPRVFCLSFCGAELDPEANSDSAELHNAFVDQATVSLDLSMGAIEAQRWERPVLETDNSELVVTLHLKLMVIARPYEESE